MQKWNNKIEFFDLDFETVMDYPCESIDYQFVSAHSETLRKIYEKLGDLESQKCMVAYLNQKISGKGEYLKRICRDNQYYEKGLVNLGKVSCIVDCGAYDGDSFRSFIINFKEDTGEDYNGTAFLLEPDEKNCLKLRKHYSGDKNVKIVKAGAWNERAFLRFNLGEEDTANRISEFGSIMIAVDKIDNIVPEQTRVDFIKMDIEGSELNALKGAENIIKRDHPMLAICVYHKRDDLLTIPQYIMSLHDGYRLYLRAYKKYASDLVLYALP